MDHDHGNSAAARSNIRNDLPPVLVVIQIDSNDLGWLVGRLVGSAEIAGCERGSNK